MYKMIITPFILEYMYDLELTNKLRNSTTDLLERILNVSLEYK